MPMESIENHEELPRKGALGKLDAVIDNTEVCSQQYNFLIRDNRYLPDNLRLITEDDFLHILIKMREGLLEAQKCIVDDKVMGEDAIPSDIGWVSGIIQGEGESKIGYQADGDRILITGKCIAELADAAKRNLGYPYDKLGNDIVKADDLALLLMAEEASHRYDIQVRGFESGDSTMNRSHPIEKNARQIIVQIVKSLSISTFNLK